MKIIVKYSFIIILFLLGCDKRNNPISINQINLDFKDGKYLNMSEVFKDFSIIQLETNKESVIGEITKIQLTDSSIFILDYWQRKLFKFNNNGKFIKAIHKTGNGPNQYRSLNDFEYYKSKLYLLSHNSKKLFIYTKDLELEKTVRLKFYYNKLAVINDNYIAFYANFSSHPDYKLKNILIYNIKENEIEKGFMEFKKSQNLQNASKHNVFSKTNDSVFLLFPCHYEVKCLSTNGVKPYLNINFCKNKVYPDKVKDFNHDEIKRYDKEHNYNMIDRPILRIEKFYMMGNYLYFSFINKGLLYRVCYNRNTKRYKVGYLTSDKIIPLNLNNVNCSFKGELISYISPSSLSYKFYQEPSIRKRLKEKGLDIDSIKFDENPIITKFKLK